LQESKSSRTSLGPYTLFERAFWSDHEIDMLSLLESRYNKLGEQSMSPAIKGMNIAGKVAHEQWEERYMQPKEQLQLETETKLISLGTSMKTLTSAADTLLKAATRLEHDVRRETQYWDEVLSVTERGWSVFRLAGDRRVNGIQFSAQEAGPFFSSRGIAALRSNDDGTIQLDRGLTITPKALRIRLRHDGKIVGSTRPNLFRPELTSSSALEVLIRRARDSLFEEELYHEMALEACHLRGFGVIHRDNIIHVPGSSRVDYDKRMLLIDLISLDDPPDPEPNTSLDDVANGIGLFARLLLSHTFRQRLRKRSQVPPPISDAKNKDLPQRILRPIVGQLQHDRSIEELYGFLSDIGKSFRSAGLAFHVETQRRAALDRLHEVAKSSSSTDENDQIFPMIESLCQPLKSTILVTLPTNLMTPSQGLSMTIDVHTQVYPPIPRVPDQVVGDQYDLHLPPELLQLMLGMPTLPASPYPKFAFHDFDDLSDYLSLVFKMNLAKNVLASKLDGWTMTHRLPEFMRTFLVKGEKQQVIIGVSLEGSKLVLHRRRAQDMEPLETRSWNGTPADDSVLAVVKAWRIQSPG
jgi:mediator of RNA polymerase II transcription subunit 17, fungi type